ncbi:MAG: NUDIX domain-containing protein [Clostridia bacterium]|nr:NUDIX domain-containing protein [Clostridia bacterium]
MQYEKSCGAVVLRREGERTYVLLIRHKKGGHRSFPKGHVERGESERRTAEREVREETGARINIRERFRVPIRYRPMPGVEKEVVYFLAFTDDPAIRPREGEIAEVEWMPLDRADEALSHDNDRMVLRSARRYLASRERVEQ